MRKAVQLGTNTVLTTQPEIDQKLPGKCPSADLHKFPEGPLVGDFCKCVMWQVIKIDDPLHFICFICIDINGRRRKFVLVY